MPTVDDLTHLEGARGHIVAATEPHLLDQLSVGLRDLPPHTQRVLPVELHLILVIQEVVCECGRIAQALERRQEPRVRRKTLLKCF